MCVFQDCCQATKHESSCYWNRDFYHFLVSRSPSKVDFYSLVCRILLVSAGIEVNPGPPSKFTGFSVPTIAQAILEVTNGVPPSDEQYKSLRGKTSFWSLVAAKLLGEECKWNDKIAKTSRYLYNQFSSKKSDFQEQLSMVIVPQNLQLRINEDPKDSDNNVENNNSQAKSGYAGWRVEQHEPEVLSDVPDVVSIMHPVEANNDRLAVSDNVVQRSNVKSVNSELSVNVPPSPKVAIDSSQGYDSDIDEQAACRIISKLESDDLSLNMVKNPDVRSSEQVRPAGSVGSITVVKAGSNIIRQMFMNPDGSCFFHALAHQMYGNEALLPKNTHYTVRFRKEICVHIKNHLSRYRLSVLIQVQDAIDADPNCRYKDMKDENGRVNEDAQIAAYLEDLVAGVSWGGYDTLAAAAELYGLNIEVYDLHGSSHTISTENSVATRTIRLLFTGDHYNSVISVEREQEPLYVPKNPALEVGDTHSTPKKIVPKTFSRAISGLNPSVSTERTEKLGIQTKFSFKITHGKWNEMFNRSKGKLEGWTDLFSDEFSKHGNAYCVLVFKTSRATSPSKTVTAPRFRAIAHCKFDNCYSFTFTVARRGPKHVTNNDDVVVEVQTFGDFNHPEGKEGEEFLKLRRQYKGERRQQLRQMTKKNLPNEIKLELLHIQEQKHKEVLLAGNYNAAPSRVVMQKISSEQKLQEDLGQDVWEDIEQTAEKYKKDFGGDVIHRIGRLPFQIIWQTPRQTKYYEQVKPTQVHIDATGSEICKLPGTRSDIHHYALSVKGKPGKPPLTITEFLTEAKDTTNITLWLSTWIDVTVRTVGKFTKPVVAVMDYSWVCIHSTLRVFAGMDIIQYLHSVLEDDIQHPVIQICCSHIIHAIARYLKKKTKNTAESAKARDLALSLFASMQRTMDIDEAKELAHHSFVIFDSETLSPEVEESIAVVEKKLGGNRGETVTYDSDETNDSNESDNSSSQPQNNKKRADFTKRDSNVLYKQSPFYDQFQQVMIKDIREHSEKYLSNPFHIQGYMKHLSTYFLPYYPLWSCYTLKKIGYPIGEQGNPPSNWPAEMVFNVSKNFILEKKLRRTPGRFLREMVPGVDKRFTDALFDPDQITSKRKITDKKTGIHTAEDRWRGSRRREAAYSKENIRRKFSSKVHPIVSAGNKIKAKYLSPRKIKLPSIAEQTERYLSPVLQHDDNGNMFVDSPAVILNKTEPSVNGDKKKLSTRRSLLFDDDIESESKNDHKPPNLANLKRACSTTPPSSRGNPWESVVGWTIDPFSQSDEKVTTTGGGVEIYISVLNTLRPKGCLSEDILEQFLATRCKIAQDMLNLSIYAFDVSFMTQLRSKGKEQTWSIKKAVQQNLLGRDVLLVPVNIRGEHWILVVIVRKHKVVIYLDSITSQVYYDDDVVPLLKGFLLGEYQRTWGTIPDWKEWSFHKPTNIPAQGNGTNDCGVYVCLWGHVICTGSTVTPNQLESERMRMWLMKEIMEKPIPELIKHSQRKTANTPSLSRSRVPIQWKTTPPLGYTSTMEYCSSLHKSLFVADDELGTCSASPCIQKGGKLYYCVLHEDWFHLGCVNDDVDSANHGENYKCPTCRSTPRAKKRKHGTKEARN